MAPEIAIIHPAWDNFLDFLFETAIDEIMAERTDKRAWRTHRRLPPETLAEEGADAATAAPELLTVDESAVRFGVSREEILAEFKKNMRPFEVQIPPPPSRRGRRKSKNHVQRGLDEP